MSLDANSAKTKITDFFKHYKLSRGHVSTHLAQMATGKLYELYCLSRVVEHLQRRGYAIQLVHQAVSFPAAPGFINRKRPYFEVLDDRGDLRFEIFLNIQFTTNGYSMRQNGRRSPTRKGLADYHEIDIIVVEAGAPASPEPHQIALAVECKSTTSFKKDIVKEVLGIRRELSLLSGEVPSKLSIYSRTVVQVPADPPSEHWLVYSDPKGDQYKESPSSYGIEFLNWRP